MATVTVYLARKPTQAEERQFYNSDRVNFVLIYPQDSVELHQLDVAKGERSVTKLTSAVALGVQRSVAAADAVDVARKLLLACPGSKIMVVPPLASKEPCNYLPIIPGAPHRMECDALHAVMIATHDGAADFLDLAFVRAATPKENHKGYRSRISNYCSTSSVIPNLGLHSGDQIHNGKNMQQFQFALEPGGSAFCFFNAYRQLKRLSEYENTILTFYDPTNSLRERAVFVIRPYPKDAKAALVGRVTRDRTGYTIAHMDAVFDDEGSANSTLTADLENVVVALSAS